MIVFKQRGNFNKTEKFFNRVLVSDYLSKLEKYGKEGVDALALATPVDSSKTANSWTYKVQRNNNGAKIIWSNSNVVNGVPIVILIQYGHSTQNGGYVQGLDFINPALRPIFDKLANEIWRGVTKL